MLKLEASVRGRGTKRLDISGRQECRGRLSAVACGGAPGSTPGQQPISPRGNLNWSSGKPSTSQKAGVYYVGAKIVHNLLSRPGDLMQKLVDVLHVECSITGRLSEPTVLSDTLQTDVRSLAFSLFGCLAVYLNGGDVAGAMAVAELPSSLIVAESTIFETRAQDARVPHHDGGKEVNLSGRLGLESSGSTGAADCHVAGAGFSVRELEGDGLMTYGQILDRRRENQDEKREMFTEDAWMGMMRLDKYSRYIESIEEQELKCKECTRNRRLLEQVWQTVSNVLIYARHAAEPRSFSAKPHEYFDGDGSFSQSQWAGELYRSLRQAGGLLRTKTETYKAAKRMVANLGDKYSSFLNPEEYRLAIYRPIPSELKYLAYQYTGIGIEEGCLTVHLQLGEALPSGGFSVVAPFAGSPAEEAGILAGEEVLSINGTRLNLLTKREVTTLLRGPSGSIVELQVAGRETGSRKLLLERRALPLPPLKTQLVDAGAGHVAAYIRLHYFTHEGTKQMAAVIREGEALGVDGYVLDLRNNPGGVFEEAIAMAALWLDCGHCDVAETVRSSTANIEDLVYSANKLPKEIFARHPGVLSHAPLVVITNRSSASASEVLTGALHDNHRVVTVGERTFGKGVVQYYFPMDDGSGLKLTVAKYLTPARYDISKQGGLEADRACHDYPHGTGLSDQCIAEALSVLSLKAEEEQRSDSHQPPLPYRWMPLNQRRLWAVGSY